LDQIYNNENASKKVLTYGKTKPPISRKQTAPPVFNYIDPKTVKWRTDELLKATKKLE